MITNIRKDNVTVGDPLQQVAFHLLARLSFSSDKLSERGRLDGRGFEDMLTSLIRSRLKKEERKK